jgi:uncharacterized membrane protein YjjP (DUF1212 family)
VNAPVHAPISGRCLEIDLLARAGRLLLEYNESTQAIHSALTATAQALGLSCQLAVSYNGVTVALPGEVPVLEPVHELRQNVCIQTRVHRILDQLRGGSLKPVEAIRYLDSVQANAEQHSRAVSVVVLGLAAASLGGLLGSDALGATVAGIATGLGLLARQELSRRHFSLLTLPLAASLIGALVGGTAIRMGWTTTPGLVLIVPALMLVPGPHLINGLLDLIDNFLAMSLARLGLAWGVLFASTLGIVIGLELTLGGPPVAGPGPRIDHLNFFSDVVLAAMVTCGFAVYYNTPWSLVGLAAIGGGIGHGVRFLALDAGATLEVATFAGALGVGVISGCLTRCAQASIAGLGFAGAVTMMPGLQLYRALSGAVHLARQGGQTAPEITAATFGNAFQACIVIAALATGLILGARTVLALLGSGDTPIKIAPREDNDQLWAGNGCSPLYGRKHELTQ